jgi:hypothetical protein
MNFDWLITWSTALFASVIGVSPSPAVNVDVAESREKITVEQQIDNSKPATEADFVKEFNGILNGEFVPREKLNELSQKELTKEVLVKNLLAKVEEKLPPNFQYPPIKDVIKFRDILRENPIFEAAQKLSALEILPENEGFFGQPNEKNPIVKISELKQTIRKAFDEKGELNYLQDKDLDGVPNTLDACPDIPAKNGCPEIEKEDKFPNETVLTVSDDVKVVDETEIQIGDKFSAIIFDPVSEEIFAESAQLTVTK